MTVYLPFGKNNKLEYFVFKWGHYAIIARNLDEARENVTTENFMTLSPQLDNDSDIIERVLNTNPTSEDMLNTQFIIEYLNSFTDEEQLIHAKSFLRFAYQSWNEELTTSLLLTYPGCCEDFFQDFHPPQYPLILRLLTAYYRHTQEDFDYACCRNQLYVVKIILDRNPKCDIDAGITTAASENHTEIVDYLTNIKTLKSLQSREQSSEIGVIVSNSLP